MYIILLGVMWCFWAFLLQNFGIFWFPELPSTLMLAHVVLTWTLFYPVVSKLSIHWPWSRLKELWLQSGRKCAAVAGFHFVIFTCFIPKDMLSPLVSFLYFSQKFHLLHGGTNEARSLINSWSCFFFLSLFSLCYKMPMKKKPKAFN